MHEGGVSKRWWWGCRIVEGVVGVVVGFGGGILVWLEEKMRKKGGRNNAQQLEGGWLLGFKPPQCCGWVGRREDEGRKGGRGDRSGKEEKVRRS